MKVISIASTHSCWQKTKPNRLALTRVAGSDGDCTDNHFGLASAFTTKLEIVKSKQPSFGIFEGSSSNIKPIREPAKLDHHPQEHKKKPQSLYQLLY